MASAALNRPSIPLATGPIILAMAMLCVSLVTWSLGGPHPGSIIGPYIGAAVTTCSTSVAVFAFIEVAKLAKAGADKPIPTVIASLKPKLPMLAIPALILPLFLSGYTAVKSAIPEIVGFRFDGLYAELDAAIFGTDPWRLTHAVIGSLGTQIIEAVHVPIWIAALAYTKAFVALFADHRLAITFYTASLLTWIVGGFLCAFAMTAAGPAFTDLNGLEWHFVELRAHLLHITGMDSPFITGPAYLVEAMEAGEAYRGGGISAMPSMHIAVCTIYCLAAWGTRWFIPSILFLSVIIVGSIHSGYHYAVDAPVAALIAYLCWTTSDRFYRDRVRDDRMIAREGPAVPNSVPL